MAKHSHKRDTKARVFTRVPGTATLAGSLAVFATASAVSLGVLTAGAGVSVTTAVGLPEAASGPITGGSSSVALDIAGDLDRRAVSRSGGRGAEKVKGAANAGIKGERDRLTEVEKALLPKNVRQAIEQADRTQFTTEVLNLWTEPGDSARQTGTIDAARKVTVTGRTLLGRDEIVFGKKQTRWVTSGYLADEKPEPPAEEEVASTALGGSCTNGSSVAAGVSPNIVEVHQAVCAAFPGITSYGTFRSDGEHAQGIAVDIMVSGEEGYQVAELVRANAAALGVSYLIYAQRIWSVERAGEGWRAMSDRGSVTANHYDHVHVTTY